MLWCYVHCTWCTWRVQPQKLMWGADPKKQRQGPLGCVQPYVRSLVQPLVNTIPVHVLARGAVQQLVIVDVDTRH
jgi:hypothetical protein